MRHFVSEPGPFAAQYLQHAIKLSENILKEMLEFIQTSHISGRN